MYGPTPPTGVTVEVASHADEQETSVETSVEVMVVGEQLPIGTYYYVIELNEEGFEPYTGPITVLR